MARGKTVPLPGGEGTIRGTTVSDNGPTTGRMEPGFVCPVTGFTVPVSEGIVRRGQWVSPLADDERGYKDTEFDNPAPPLPIHYTRRNRPKPDPNTGN